MCNNILEIALDMKNLVSLLNKFLTRYVSEIEVLFENYKNLIQEYTDMTHISIW